MKTHEKHVHEPLFHIVKRDNLPTWKAMLIRVIAVVFALLFSYLLAMLLIDKVNNPVQFFKAIFEGTFRNTKTIWVFVQELTLLLCLSLAVTPAFRMRFWNIGAEGQTLAGALAAIAVIVYFGKTLPLWLLLILMLAAAMLAGAIWAVIPAIFKAKWNTNETLFTLMMNYVATFTVDLCLRLWQKNSLGNVQNNSMTSLAEGRFPEVLDKAFLPALIVVALAVVVFIYLNYTKHGYEISVVGESENTARYIGIRVDKVIVRTMMVSGAICGVAGFLIASAFNHSIAVDSVGGLGFTAIMASWLAKFNPLAMIGSSAFIVFLNKGGDEMTTVFNTNDSLPNTIIGIVLFFLIGCEFFIGYRLKFRKFGKKGGNKQ